MTRLERKNWKDYFQLKTNLIIKTLTISDIFILSGFGFISPIFAVFLTDNIHGGNLEVAGIASTIYLLTRSLGQLPVAQIIDQIRGEKDDFWAMLIGSIGTSFVPLFYLIAKTPAHIYLIQFFYGIFQAITYPSWLAIFTRHIDLHQEGTAWGIYYTLTDLGGAATAGMGGIIAYQLGFIPLFWLVSLLSFCGSFWLLFIQKKIGQEETRRF